MKSIKATLAFQETSIDNARRKLDEHIDLFQQMDREYQRKSSHTLEEQKAYFAQGNDLFAKIKA